MHHTDETDADLLWHDVLTLAGQRDIPPATIAMLASCTPSSLDDTTLTITTHMGFAQRKIAQQADVIEACIEEAAFQHLTLVVRYMPSADARIDTTPTITAEEYAKLHPEPTAAGSSPSADHDATPDVLATPADRRQANPLFEDVPTGTSKLTFERFVAGEENLLALEAAKQVANGENKSYNPLFIHGHSGLGKTHLLRAIQNYINVNDPSRLCVYRTAGDFVDEYVSAVRDERAGLPKSVLARHYQDVDVLIIDDVQNMSTAAGSIRFFFETFNYLTSHDRQVVLAADRSPGQLGLGNSSFDERDTSRMDSGVTVSIQVPDYELKLNLVTAFYERMKADAADEHVSNMDGTIDDDLLKLMAERAGTNIRTIEGFVQSCLLLANQRERAGSTLTREDVARMAGEKWPGGRQVVTIEQIQKAIESHYGVPHAELVGSKRNKELMEPRHVAIWLARSLTDNTLADIGKRFGNRSHATVKHSIAWVDDYCRRDRDFQARMDTLAEDITNAR